MASKNQPPKRISSFGKGSFNPLVEDEELQSLLKSVGSITAPDQFAKWRTSFLDKLESFLPFWTRYEARFKDHTERGRVDSGLARYRWMLEEFRISLFAQELGTRFAVSAQRLEASWQQVAA